MNMFARKPNRIKKFDYSHPNFYFVTICTKDRREHFGEIFDCEMVLNNAGQAAEDFWEEIPKHYDNVELDEFIIMPNHLHGIVILETKAGGLQSNLSQIIGSYKNIVSKHLHTGGFANFAWQKSFYDNVIRDEKSLRRIREYIRNNPRKWGLDRNNRENLWM
jgi:REP element-mobilizing transposase RayT